MQDVYAVGLMSGTSADGIDAALVAIEDPDRPFPGIRLVHAIFEPFDSTMRQRILRAVLPDAPVSLVGPLDRELGEQFAEAANRVIEESGMARSAIRVIGSHGQTIAHYPDGPQGFSWQIGEPAVIAARTGIPVVSHFRSMDVALGGQGAPLVPYFDYARLASPEEDRVVLNIGGIANVTILPRGGGIEGVAGYDTGPGNMILDGAMSILSNGELAYDRDGEWASRGRVDHELLHAWLAHPYFSLRPPKSAGREQFGQDYVRERVREAKARGLSKFDILRTLTTLTAATISEGIRMTMPQAAALIASGGGVRNPVLMRELASRLSLVRPWEASGHYGIPDEAKEAMAFAYFAHQLSAGRPTSLPSTTGASRVHLQGSLTMVDGGLA